MFEKPFPRAPFPGKGAQEQDGRRSLLSVQDLAVHFFTKKGVVPAVDGVSFDLEPGERMAIVGESGSGKSVLSMSMLKLVSHPGRIVGGRVSFAGRDLLSLDERQMNAVRGKDVAMVFQDPMASLNPVLTVEEQITAPLRRHTGIGKTEAHARAIDLLQQVGIPAPADRLRSYPHQLSGGMRQRVLIAMALACGPKLLLADEPTTALDVTIQAQIVALLKDLSDRLDMAVVFVTHDLGLVARFAHKVAVMYAGRFVEVGTAEEIFEQPRHPYTQGLLGSIPAITGERPGRLVQIPGAPPDLLTMGVGCPFEPRCGYAGPECRTERPPLMRRGGAEVACWMDITAPAGKELAVVGR